MFDWLIIDLSFGVSSKAGPRKWEFILSTYDKACLFLMNLMSDIVTIQVRISNDDFQVG